MIPLITKDQNILIAVKECIVNSNGLDESISEIIQIKKQTQRYLYFCIFIIASFVFHKYTKIMRKTIIEEEMISKVRSNLKRDSNGNLNIKPKPKSNFFPETNSYCSNSPISKSQNNKRGFNNNNNNIFDQQLFFKDVFQSTAKNEAPLTSTPKMEPTKINDTQSIPLIPSFLMNTPKLTKEKPSQNKVVKISHDNTKKASKVDTKNVLAGLSEISLEVAENKKNISCNKKETKQDIQTTFKLAIQNKLNKKDEEENRVSSSERFGSTITESESHNNTISTSEKSSTTSMKTNATNTTNTGNSNSLNVNKETVQFYMTYPAPSLTSNWNNTNNTNNNNNKKINGKIPIAPYKIRNTNNDMNIGVYARPNHMIPGGIPLGPRAMTIPPANLCIQNHPIYGPSIWNDPIVRAIRR